MKIDALTLAIRAALAMAVVLVLAVEGLPTGTVPLLFLLFVAELGAGLSLFGLVTAICRLQAARDKKLWVSIGICLMLLIAFMVIGLSLWPQATGLGPT